MNESARILSFPVEGMDCAACARRVEKALSAVPGVAEARVNFATGSGTVHLAAGGESPAAPDLAAAVAAAGYRVPTAQAELAVEGATCASCSGRIERALAAVPGVTSARMNLATGRATVGLLGPVPAPALVAAVAAAGYTAHAVGAGVGSGPAPGEDGAAERRRFLAAAALALPVVVLEMGGHMVPAFHHALHGAFGPTLPRLVAFALTTLLLAGPGRGFFIKGWRTLRAGSPDMNALVMLGAGAAWAYSTVASFLPGVLPAGEDHVYFESAAVIVTLIVLGRWLEARARGRAGAAIGRLLELTPPRAIRLVNGREESVEVAGIAPGDLLRIRPGDRVPVDGTVTEGSSWLDESMVTGESAPVAKAAGDPVTAGTVNGGGAFTFRAERVGADTVLARIVQLVREAQGDRLPIQGLADRVTGWFVPAVIAAALLTLAGSLLAGVGTGQALVRAVAVLIVACPCAMGLATPTSILVGTGRAAELGVLFRRGAALQALSAVRTVAFDKTGTLTLGRPDVVATIPLAGFDADRVLALAAAVEARSEHPLAAAIARAAGGGHGSAPDVAHGAANGDGKGHGLPEVEGFRADPGGGVEGTVDGHAVRVGNAGFLAAAGVDPGPLAAVADREAAAARTPVLVAVDGRPAAVIAVADRIRPEAPAALAALRRQGLGLAMVTGDIAPTARAVARELGIDRVEAGVRPEGKVEAVRRLGAGVAFVGDGVNDAPVLAAADVGLAIGTGTDIAVESADVVLMSGDTRKVADAVKLSRATMRNIRENLFWAFAYNILLIPVAAGLLVPVLGFGLSPALAAGAMALSSTCVLGNALRLRLVRPAVLPEAAPAAPAAPARERAA